MGVVYLARELRLDRRVAIKLLPPERAFQPTARQRFLREARTAAQLSHPGIVPIFAVHEVSDFVYFAMAYVDGGTLGRRVRQRGPLPHDAAARLLEEVARALAYAHDRGVVHRDVKPDNILLDLATRRGWPRRSTAAWPRIPARGSRMVQRSPTRSPARWIGARRWPCGPS